MNDLGDNSLLRRRYVYVKSLMQFENATLFCFLISVQFSRANNQSMLIPGVKKIQIFTRKWNSASCILIRSSYQSAMFALCSLKDQ
jgi:hypothetical protein